MNTSPIRLTQFEPHHQVAARQLILDGLKEHWETLDLTRNLDLDDIAASYHDGVFILGWLDDKLVGTGALIPEAEGVWRIVRMSVDKAVRRQGIGRLILETLIEAARAHGAHKIVLETTATWADAIGFYRRLGFRRVEIRDGELHLELDLIKTDKESNGPDFYSVCQLG